MNLSVEKVETAIINFSPIFIIFIQGIQNMMKQFQAGAAGNFPGGMPGMPPGMGGMFGGE